MKILLNDVMTTLPNDYMTLDDLANWKGIPSQGTALALNNKLIKQELWKVTNLKDGDQVTVISAAFGG